MMIALLTMPCERRTGENGSWPHQVLPMQATAHIKAISAHHAILGVVRLHELRVRPAKAVDELLEFDADERAPLVCGTENPASPPDRQQ